VQKLTMLWRGVPKSSAVLNDSPTEDAPLASVIRKMAVQINLQELSIRANYTKKTNTGGIFLEADLLAEKIQLVVDTTA